ncbi:MAG: ROK family protein [Candidatus Zambryskibacteria bacterium]|nr:ROK family protein [Candidatus Zambryskibacteria bacterium]
MIFNSILFDVGATKTRIAYSENGEFFEDPKVYETSKDKETFLDIFKKTAEELAKNREIKIVAGGMTRALDFKPEEIKEKLTEIFGVKILMDNDSAVVGLGEANWGAGRGFQIMAYITVSTGVGGVRIVDGKIDERSVNFEPGKQIMDIDSGKTLEDMISGKNLEKREGRSPKEISNPEIWEDLAEKLAMGLNNIAVEWSPDCIVLGGSMIIGNPAISIEKAENHFKEILKIFPKLPEIRKAELGDFGGLYGALVLIKQKPN